MGRWLDLAARLEKEAEGCANSANNANGSFSECFGTNDTIGTAGVPTFIALGLHRLRSMPTPRVTNPAVWPEIVADASRLAQEGWAAKAIDLSWDALHLFGWEPGVDLEAWDYSLAVVMEGWLVVDVSADYITLRKGNVSRPFKNRPRPALTRYLWEL